MKLTEYLSDHLVKNPIISQDIEKQENRGGGEGEWFS